MQKTTHPKNAVNSHAKTYSLMANDGCPVLFYDVPVIVGAWLVDVLGSDIDGISAHHIREIASLAACRAIEESGYTLSQVFSEEARTPRGWSHV